ncbi:MAG: phosphate ABC transporter permease PstA [Pseudomonadales bacterium]|nr:phosphate ABC transporter permease PstA [Pseudomonadales bacterium]
MSLTTNNQQSAFAHWWKSGNPMIWINAGAVSISLIMVFGLLGLIAARGGGHFWPKDVLSIEYKTIDGKLSTIVGELIDTDVISKLRYEESTGQTLPKELREVERWMIKVGNRDQNGADFKWVSKFEIQKLGKPSSVVAVERMEWGTLFGELKSISENGVDMASHTDLWSELHHRLDRTLELRDLIRQLEKSEIGRVNYVLEKLRLERRTLELDGTETAENLREIAAKERHQQEIYKVIQRKLEVLNQQIKRDKAKFEIINEGHSQIVELPFAVIVGAIKPNVMNAGEKLIQYFINLYHFFMDDPREANTEGGIFPAIFGTVMMVLLMTVLVTPFGVIAAVYLREYAKQGPVIRIIRIAVNNLAGVPSIVYGVFGLGFFVYFLGGNIDDLFFTAAKPAPTVGTPGIMWAALTLAIMTVPVVIVSTEEGLTRIPRSIREGSLALGATRFETLRNVILPMASPSIMTGVILAIARAAGEVAPLMLVGVVKLAPDLPIDANFPFVHLERKFMHLGFHIYDVGFQSPNVEVARPLVYATSFLLVLVIIFLNLAVILMRNKLRERYRSMEN